VNLRNEVWFYRHHVLDCPALLMISSRIQPFVHSHVVLTISDIFDHRKSSSRDDLLQYPTQTLDLRRTNSQH